MDSIIKLKEKRIEKINGIDDEELLHEIAHVIDFEPEVTDRVYIMSPGEIAAVNEGLEQLKSVQWASHEEANREIDEWLKK